MSLFLFVHKAWKCITMSCVLITIRFMSSFKWNPNKNNNTYVLLFNISRHFKEKQNMYIKTRRKIEIECLIIIDAQTDSYLLYLIYFVLCQYSIGGNKWLILIIKKKMGYESMYFSNKWLQLKRWSKRR